MAKQKCSICGHDSIPGLRSGKCQFHWTKGAYGIEWAAKIYPEHREAQVYLTDRNRQGTP